MPVRTYERKIFGGLHNIAVNGCDLESEEDIERMNKSLVFLDLNTGLHRRGISRDPICGLGDLPAEIDILEGCSLKRSVSPGRDPITMRGDLGIEYNCLYTTKDLTCRPKDDRNVLTLKGNLGGEIDPIRPHGGKPRSNIKNEAVRNPITGSGDFGQKEWDPIWKYDGKHVINRPEQVPRDPITHNVPIKNMGEQEPRSHYKHFEVTKDTDVIRHDDTIKDLRNTDHSCNSTIRHFSNQESRNPITHVQTGSPDEKPYRSGTKHFYNKIKSEDYIAHHGFSDDIAEQQAKQEFSRQQAKLRVFNDPIGHYVCSDENNGGDVEDREGSSHLDERVLRNPITGVGIKEKDIKITQQSYQSFRVPPSANVKESKSVKSSK